jgi:HEAT repeat protein
MSKKRRTPPDLPAELPSIPDSESEPPKYNEPDLPKASDRVPTRRFEPAARESRAELRIRIEELLRRKESPPATAWADLGNDAKDLLVDLLDDEAIRSHDAIRHRVIAVLGELGVQRSVPRLISILADNGERPVTKAFAVSSLGRIGGAAATDALAPLVGAQDDMLRRQVGIALGRIDRPEVIPHLLALHSDESNAVSEVAAEALRTWEERLGKRLAPRQATGPTKYPKKKSLPAPER